MTGQDHASTHDQAEAASDDALERAVAAMTRACGPVVTASPAALMSGLDQGHAGSVGCLDAKRPGQVLPALPQGRRPRCSGDVLVPGA